MSTDQYLCNWFFSLFFFPNVRKFDKRFLYLRQTIQEKYIPGLSDKHKWIQSVQVLSAATYFSGLWSLLLIVLNQNDFLWVCFNHLCLHWATPKGRSASSLLGSFLMQKPAGASFSLGSGLSRLSMILPQIPLEENAWHWVCSTGHWGFIHSRRKVSDCWFALNDAHLCPQEYLNLWKSCSHWHVSMHYQKLRDRSSAPVALLCFFPCFVTGF